MKKLLTLILFSISFNSVYSQDIIVKINNDSIKCKVIEITDDNIKYKYLGEDVKNNISKNVVSEIIFESGRIEKFSKKIIINGEEDWEKVQITNFESDVEGLAKYKLITAKAKGTTMTSQGKVERKALKRLRKEAAINGCHIILILTSGGKSGGHYSAANSNFSGWAYKY